MACTACVVYGQGPVGSARATDAAGASASPQTALAALDAIDDKEWLTQSSRALLERVIAAASKAALDEAAKSDPRAQALVGSGYCFGLNGYSQDNAEAAKFYRLGAVKNPIAQTNLGVMLMDGRASPDGKPAPDAAARYYRMAAGQGHPVAALNLAVLFKDGSGVAQDYKQAAIWFKRAASRGIAQAQYELGELYRNGFGVAMDDEEGLRLIKLAADQGYADALFAVAVEATMEQLAEGNFLENDDPKNPTVPLFAKALAAFERDAAAGSAYAMRQIAQMYYNQEVVAKDSAYANYKKAADGGDRDALLIVGVLTETGQGIAKDEAEAARIYRDRADQGDPLAQTYLGHMIETGRGGLKADKAEAIRLYKLASQQGEWGARSALERLGEKW
jgi:TPR repeat protein